MAVDSLLASSPLTLTRQIVESTGQTLEQVRENVEKVLLEEGEDENQSASRPGSKPVGSAQPSSEDNGLGQGAAGDGESEGDGQPSFRGQVVNTSA